MVGGGGAEMNNEERGGLLRDLSDALTALQARQSIDTLDGLADHLGKLGPSYRFHAALIRGAARRRDYGALTAQLIQTLAKLERGVR
jgi:hypothetical protein